MELHSYAKRKLPKRCKSILINNYILIYHQLPIKKIIIY